VASAGGIPKTELGRISAGRALRSKASREPAPERSTDGG
jgi:hypothetical protein